MTPVPPAPTDATTLLRQYCDSHQRAVERTLACCGVPAADRPDVAQEVFLAAYRELHRTSTPIDQPGPWLGRVAIRRASNYRRSRRSTRVVSFEEREVEQLVHSMESPEQRFDDCALLARLFDAIDDEAKSVVLAHLAEDQPWETVAKRHRMSVDRAKYVHAKAIASMEAALKRMKLAENRRGAAVAPIALVQLFDVARADADAGLDADEQRRRGEAMERKLAHGPGEEPEESDDHPDALESRPTPTGINPIARRPTSPINSLVTFVAGGIAGFVLSMLLRQHPPPALPLPSAPPSPKLVLVPRDAPPEVVPAVLTSVPVPSAAEPSRRPESAPMPDQAGPELDYAKLEQARSALAAGEPLKALRALDRCTCGELEDVRRGLWAKACSAPETRRLPECAATP